MNEALRDILNAPGPNRLERTFPGTLRDMFHREAPLEVEIGAGKGRFLLHRAQAMPDVNFVGFDYIWKYLKRGWSKAVRWEIPNVLFFKAEAHEVITHLIEDGTVSVFHVYFPDPWHKKKHRHRRLLTPEFFQLLHRRLEPSGLLEIATDNFDYLIALKAALVEAGDTLWSDVRESRNERFMNPEARTNFELKYEAEERDIYYLELRK